MVTSTQEKRIKILPAETISLGQGRIQAVVSTEDKDRDGDIIRASGWQLGSFLKHPVLLSSHDYGSLMSQIGEWENVRVEGTKLVGTAKYYINEGNEEADWAHFLATQKMAAFSVGFMPDMSKAREIKNDSIMPNFEFRGQELLEISHVTVPSNRESLQRLYKSTKDPVISLLAEKVMKLKGAAAQSIPNYALAGAQEEIRKIDERKKKEDSKLNKNMETARRRFTQPHIPIPGDGDFDSFGQFLKVIQRVGTVFYPRDTRVTPEQKRQMYSRLKVLGEGEGDQGGFIVADDFRTAILAKGADRNIVRPRALVVSVTSGKLAMPAARHLDGSTGDYAGIKFTWVPEDEALVARDLRLGQVVLNMHKLIALFPASVELVEDVASPMEDYLLTVAGIALARVENRAFLVGTGVGQPTGMLNSSAVIPVAKEVGQAADTVTYTNVTEMEARLLGSSFETAIWVCHPTVLPQLRKMSVSIGTGGGGVFAENGTSTGPVRALLGRPLFVTDVLPPLGDLNDIGLVDAGMYVIGDREVLTLDYSDQVDLGDTGYFRIRNRLDGRPWLDQAVTPENGSDTLSAYVSLAERA